MGIVKLCITILFIIWTIYTINGFVLWWNNTQTEDEPELKLSEFLLKEHKLCVDGGIYTNETGLVCDKGRVKIIYSCNETGCIRDINIRER